MQTIHEIAQEIRARKTQSIQKKQFRKKWNSYIVGFKVFSFIFTGVILSFYHTLTAVSLMVLAMFILSYHLCMNELD